MTRIRYSKTYKGQYQRARQCPRCHKIFHTYEVSAEDAQLLRNLKKAMGKWQSTAD